MTTAGPVSDGPGVNILKWVSSAPQNRANFAGPPAAFLELQNTHACGVSVLPLSERAPGPGICGLFWGVNILKWGSSAPKTWQILPGPPRRFESGKTLTPAA